jgi:hypothetical protein
MKRKAKSTGSGGRLRLALLLATAAAFLLVPATQAFAITTTATVEGAGEGSGWLKGVEGTEGGEPPLDCHWNGELQEFDEGITVVSGECKTGTKEIGTVTGIGFESIPDLGSEYGGGEVIEGTAFLPCEEEFCSAAAFAQDSPIKFKIIFDLEPVAPSNVTPPTITGTAKIGKTLHGNAGTWEGGPESFTNKWLRCDEAGENCVEVAAETTEYEVEEADAEHTFRFEETATNTVGSASATSAQTAVVPAAGGEGEATLEPERNVYGEVEETTELTSNCEVELFLGYFKPGEAGNYPVSCVVVATATGEENSLTASDESNEGAEKTGYLKNTDHPTTYWLAQALEVQATDLDNLGESSSTLFGTMEPSHTLLHYGAPVSADNVEVEFNQPIAAQDPLRTGVYQKVITLTLQQENP